MRYKDMEKGFQFAFSSAFRAYRRGSTAIGCAIMNADNECVSRGENSIYANDNTERINRHNLAHAEINAIFKVKSGSSHVSNNVLYTTMEPCIMCFGAIIMCYYKKVKFASLDPFGGATGLNEQNRYGLLVEGPFEELQDIQVALSIYRGLKLGLSYVNNTISIYKDICGGGVDLGRRLYNDALFGDMINDPSGILDEAMIDYMFAQRAN